MLNTLNDVLNNVDNFIWGMPLIILILFTGILLTVRLLGHNFFVFFNAETEQVNVVYKRKGNTYGLIEPEF